MAFTLGGKELLSIIISIVQGWTKCGPSLDRPICQNLKCTSFYFIQPTLILLKYNFLKYNSGRNGSP